jgi:hypothetical protein
VFTTHGFHRFLEKDLGKLQVHRNHLPHILSYLTLEVFLDDSRIFSVLDLLISSGCGFGDLFRGHSAWQFLVYRMCALLRMQNDEPKAEKVRYLLNYAQENGADVGQVIDQININHFPNSDRDYMVEVLRDGRVPCHPLNILLSNCQIRDIEWIIVITQWLLEKWSPS